jgi:hypothetical protein
MSKLKEFKYEKYNYDFLLPSLVINLGDSYKDGVIENAIFDENTNTIHITFRTSIDKLVFDININDLTLGANGY